MEMRRHRADFWLLLGYGLLLVYGTLFPLDPVDGSASVDWRRLFDWRGAWARLSLSDVLVNLLVYLPWGYLLSRRLERLPGSAAFWLTVAAGGLLSITLEYIQLYLPARVSSFSDIVLNTVGTAAGALIAMSLRHASAGRRLRRLRARLVIPGGVGDLGLLVLGAWALSELTPLVPSLDFGILKQGVKPLFLALQDSERIQWHKMAAYALNLTALGLVLRTVLRFRSFFWRAFLVVFAGVLLLKIPVVSRQLGLEACLGLGMAAFSLLVLNGLGGSRWVPWVGGAGVLIARLLEALSKGSGDSLMVHPFNWVPFAGQGNGIVGLIDILFGIWPYLALAFFARLVASSRWVLWSGALAVFTLALFLEWRQQFIPGRYPDATDAYLALAGWLFGWYYAARNRTGDAVTWEEGGAVPLWAYGTLVLGVMVAMVAAGLQSPREVADSRGQLAFPDPAQLRAPSLPAFRFEHPRLPAPSFSEITEIRRRNPRFFQVHRQRAKGGKGDFFSIALTGRIDPAAISLQETTHRLSALKFSWRGHEQGMPLALVYDWLYPRLSLAQRQALQEKLAEGCRYLIHRIRKDALSPYNVYLYNSPFQALMAVAIALYGDHPYGEQCMAFTHDFWKRRVLPVWRQIMGRHGGWHEGGEYVGIGIGRAVYTVPAMWRKATGEDLFRTEPGLRGFLDFLIYRYRPDGFHMRWGDGAFFNKWVPARFPLALEYRDRVAYGFFGCLRRFGPTAWPWGPLPDKSLCDRGAHQSLPLQKRFDGIGMVIARSDWGQDATYVTFKAGDNYWSHTHLDQGAFTLYKGGPLAIDSGLYGPRYGSDHHMNYSYQTIAHNVVTVTDPGDDAPLPPKDKKHSPRPIANDGGQRRVGSGWGKPAPVDLQDWRSQYETYHTGRIARYYEGNGLVVAIAELTPAYTNARCGKGDAFDRTCRVSRYWRTFVYDRREDVVVVHDDVTATRADFVKRSLVHSVERPRMIPGGFVLEALPKPALHRTGGRLEVKVLFPQGAYLNSVGGKGFEFWVDGKNYDGRGEVWRKVARLREPKPEPGRWRVEIVPPQQRERDRFLMVLKPSLRGRHNPTRIVSIEEGDVVGCRLEGEGRSVTLRFPPDRPGVRIGLSSGGRIDLTLPPE